MEPIDEARLKDALNANLGRFPKAESLALAAMRHAIITGALAPGQEIDEERIAGFLEMSRTPVRQAMGILESEGLVKRAYKRGVTVTRLTAAEIEEIYTLRAMLEGLAIRRAVPQITDEQLEAARAVMERMSAGADDADTFVELNARFHTLLYEPCEWDTLQSIIVRLRNNVAGYIVMSYNDIHRTSSYRADHERILEACVARDPDAAENSTRAHILGAMDILLAALPSDA